MEPVSLVVAALVAGATAGASNAASTLVMDVYEGLKGLVTGRLRGAGVADAQAQRLVEQAPDRVVRDELTDVLTRVEVDEPTVEAAQRLLELLKEKGKYVVDASQAKGVIVGDHGVQHNTFN